MVIDKVLVIASALIKDKLGRVLLLQRSQKSSYPDYWQLVEGKLEENESPTETIKREVKEETAVEAKRTKFDNVYFNEIEAKDLKYLTFRVVFNTTISTGKIKISDEHTSFGWFAKQEIKNLNLLPGTEKVLSKLLA